MIIIPTLPTAKTASVPPVFEGFTLANSTTSITLPSHDAGDLILVWAVEPPTSGVVTGAVATIPSAGGTVPAWSNTLNPGVNTGYLFHTIATSNSHTSGTFWGTTPTNPRMIAVVVSGQGESPIGGAAYDPGATSGNPVAPAISLVESNGSSMLIQFTSTTNFRSLSFVPEGYTARSSTGNNPNRVFTKNDTTTDGAITFVPSASTSGWMAAQVEIRGT